MNVLEETPNVKQAVPFLEVSNIDESLKFYVDGLGCAMTQHWVVDNRVRWCRLEIGDAALMLQELTDQNKKEKLSTGPAGLGVTLVYMCEDALAIYREATSRGLTASRPFVGNGMWVTELSDPDGYHVLFESITDHPEGSVYKDG